MNTKVKSIEQERFETFLTACENVADDVDCIVGNMGYDDLAVGGPGQVKRFVHLWREAGKPNDGEPGTGGLEISLRRTQAAMRSMEMDTPIWMDRIEKLIEQAKRYKENMS